MEDFSFKIQVDAGSTLALGDADLPTGHLELPFLKLEIGELPPRRRRAPAAPEGRLLSLS
jgi:hypothetical protein